MARPPIRAAALSSEFRRYLKCGLLAHGFARVQCESCDHDRLVAFSSCAGRRMSDTAAFLADHVLPIASYRQWIIDGWANLGRLKRNPRTRHIPVHMILVMDRQQRGVWTS